MKLYELERDSKFILECNPEVGTFILERVDGMYSRCLDKDNNIINIAAFTDVEKVLDK